MAQLSSLKRLQSERLDTQKIPIYSCLPLPLNCRPTFQDVPHHFKIKMQIPPLSKFSYFFFIVISLLYVSRCLKITEKVSFNIASKASYVYILSGQKLIKNAKNGPFWRVFENLKLAVKQCYQTDNF